MFIIIIEIAVASPIAVSYNNHVIVDLIENILHTMYRTLAFLKHHCFNDSFTELMST
jgi:hypothetical protein